MGLKPNVTTEDLTGVDIQGVIEYVDNNNVRITFNQAVAGKAYLS
jgi:FKBP-type peptidyl-prolyl cis-trans isomerase 2